MLLSFQTVQKTYAIVGALVIPGLSAILLYLNNRSDLVSRAYRNGWKTNLILALAVLLFVYAGWLGIQARF